MTYDEQIKIRYEALARALHFCVQGNLYKPQDVIDAALEFEQFLLGKSDKRAEPIQAGSAENAAPPFSKTIAPVGASFQ